MKDLFELGGQARPPYVCPHCKTEQTSPLHVWACEAPKETGK